MDQYTDEELTEFARIAQRVAALLQELPSPDDALAVVTIVAHIINQGSESPRPLKEFIMEMSQRLAGAEVQIITKN